MLPRNSPVFQEQLHIGLPVVVIEENRGAIVASLGDMMRITIGYDASNSWHGGMLAQ